MHTFFINTSKKSLNGYDILFDIHYENKSLVSMECPMSDWYHKDKGYLSCVKQMNEMIDGYMELNNAFNLIIYVDLSENKAYSSIQRDAFYDRMREECCRAMHILFTHVISESIVYELTNSGRRPQNILILFGEEKKFTDFRVADNDPSRQAIMEHLVRFLGLPDVAEAESIAKEVDAGNAPDKVEELKTRIRKVYKEELVPGLREHYRTDLDLWYDEIANEANVPKAQESLFERISRIHQVESNRIGVEMQSCPYDCYACRVNKAALALSQLNIALHLLKCVQSNSVYEAHRENGAKNLIPFRAYTAEEIAPLFEIKERQFAGQVERIESSGKSYLERGLVVPVGLFDHARFGLDEFGDLATDLVVEDATQKQDEKKTRKQQKQEEKSAEEASPDHADAMGIVRTEKEVTVVRKGGRTQLSDEEYQPFDSDYDHDLDQLPEEKITPERYIKQATLVRKHHLDYLKKLRFHISQVLSNYAGKSRQNEAAVLGVGKYKYAVSEDAKEERPLELVETISDKAYTAMMDQYMEFCAGRSVTVTDIEEQCNWFVSRVEQIRESLQKIRQVAVGLLVAMLTLYIPFVVIQFEAIVENLYTVLVALGSIAGPVAVLLLIYGFAVQAQKKKFRKEWDVFLEKSKQIQADNAATAAQYDELLAAVIPSLRWVYEYKLDVDYCLECCSIADAKIEHHRRKLRDRVTAIHNILGDLEYRSEEKRQPSDGNADEKEVIDYNVPFCSGQENKAFYTVVNEQFFHPSNQ